MKLLKNFNKKIATAVFSSALSFVVLVMAIIGGFSLAWFSNNREVNAGGITVTVGRNVGARVNLVEIFKRSGGDVGAKKVYSTATPGAPVEMTEYDTVFTDRNVNTPIVLRIELSDAPTTGAVSLTLSTQCDENHWTRDGSVSSPLANYFSNVVGVRCGWFHDLDSFDTDSEAENLYSEVISRLSSQTPQAFTSVSGDSNSSSPYVNVEKRTEISIEVENITPVDGIIVLYLEIDYLPSLTSAYISQNGISVDSTVDGRSDIIVFPYDIKFFCIDYQ